MENTNLALLDEFDSATVEPSVVEMAAARAQQTRAAAVRNIVWTSQHEEALIEHINAGLSYAQSAAAINEKFGTNYSRNAAIGRSNRIGLKCPIRPGETTTVKKVRTRKPRVAIVSANGNSTRKRIIETAESAEVIKLRCVSIEPRHLSILDLEPNDCRYPYGDNIITFCGHPKHEGSSYCFAHQGLTRSYAVAISDAKRQRRRQNFANIQRKAAMA